MEVLLTIVSGAALTWLILKILVPQLRINLLDQPNSRSSHRLPTPRGGGLSFVMVACASSVIALQRGQSDHLALIPLLAAPLAFIGLIDDRYSLSSAWRYAFQLITAVLVLALSPLVQGLSFPNVPGNWFLLFVIVLLLIADTAIVNFTNFMDGLDGLVGGCMVVIIFALAYSLSAPWPLWALTGSLIGFLFWNWSPAKVFMGDVGSTFLGAMFAALILQATSWPEAFGFLLVGTPLLGDACLCVIRRLIAGQRVFQAHRLHLFQRLHQSGWPHARVALTYIIATAVLAAAMLAGGWLWSFGLAVFELMIGIWLDQRVAVPFKVASQR